MGLSGDFSLKRGSFSTKYKFGHILDEYIEKNEELDKTSMKVVIRWEICRKLFKRGYVGESKANKGSTAWKQV